MNNNNISEIKKEIVIERLRQAPSNISISFGTNGGFMSRDNMIEQVKNDTELGKKIVDIQFKYLKSFKENILLSWSNDSSYKNL